MANPEIIQAARVAYLDAAIAEIQAVCNTVEATNEKREHLAQIAQLAGENAQQKFDAYTALFTPESEG